VEVSPIDSWSERASILIDGQVLVDAFEAADYRLPSGSEVYVVEIIDGADQPGYLLYEAGEGAFSIDFWPASTVKLVAAVAAVEYVADLGFTGDAAVTLNSGAEQTVSSWYEAAITVSSNDAYDRLLQVAGLDYVNNEFLAAYGLDSMQYGSSYSSLSVTTSPAMTLTEEQETGTATLDLDSRTATEDYGRNDTDLFSLVEGLRLVMLADEIPEEDRFDIPADDLAAIQQALIDSSPSFFESAAEEVFGDDVIVANKAGWVPGSECLDHAYIVDPDTGRRFLIAATQPYATGCASLGDIAEIALEAVLEAEAGVPLMADGGSQMVVDFSLTQATLGITVNADADQVIVLIDGEPITIDTITDGTLGATLPNPGSGTYVLHITAFEEGEPVSHQMLTITLPPGDFN